MNLFLAFVLTAAVLTSGSVVKPPGENFELLILHNNDMHARFEQTSQLSGACTTADREAGKCYGGFPRVAHVVKEARRAAQTGEGPPVLYLNAGDTYTGTAWFTIYKWKIAAEFINALQPDAVSLGNHEFDNGVSGLTPFIEALTCPVLASNLNLALVPELLVERNLMDSVVFDINGTQVGVIGYLTPDTQFLAIKNDVKYIEEVTAVKKEAAKLKKQGVNILIALGHSGFTKDLEIAKEVDDIDLVIGGHTNTFLWNGTSPDVEKPEGPYPTLVKQKSGRLVPAVQAYAYTKYLGKLHLVFDSEGEMIDANGNPILLDSSVNQDLEVLQIVNRYRVDIRNITDYVTGITPVILDGTSCRLRECNIGNLITDAMVEKYAKDYKGKGWTDAPIAIIQGGGIRASIAPIILPANITRGDLLRVMPFDGNLVKLSISGRDVIKMLEHAVALYNPKRPPGPFLQMSGMKVEYDFRKPPGFRVLKVSVRCGECLNPQFSVLNVTEMYNILMPAFLSMGGDGYVIFEGMPSKALPYDELESAIEYIGVRSAVYPSVEGRIVLNHLEQLQFNSGFYPKLSLPCLGNHEFDEAVDGVVPFIRNLSSPVLAANLILDKVPSLQNEKNLYKSIIVEKNNVKIGIIGYLTPETKYLAPVNDVEYEDEVVAIRREVEKLKKENVNILIALGHSGFVKDTIIAREVEDLDLVIGGHSNTFLWNSNSTSENPEIPEGPYPKEIQQPNGRIVRVVQAYAYTKYMGKLHLIFDSEGEIIKCDGIPILLNQRIPRDPELLQTINKYRNDVDRINNEVVGQSSVFLDGTCRLRECNLGDLITDAILNYTRENFHHQYQDVTIVLIQGGRIRTSIIHSGKPFVMTRGDWINVLPFSDTLCIVTMTGKILKQSLEHSVSTWRTVDSTGQFQQFSGMEVAYDLSRPVGSRVVNAKAVCTNCSKDTKLDIKDNYEYKMMMPSFIADGGDGYTMFKDLPRETLTFNELDSVLYYVKKYSPVEPQLDGRIKVLNEDKVNNGDSSKPSGGIVIQNNLKLYFALILLLWFKFLFI